jgi:hypothetical protein
MICVVLPSNREYLILPIATAPTMIQVNAYKICYKFDEEVLLQINYFQILFQVVTSLDYLYIFETLAGLDLQSKYLAEYVCELALLQSELGAYIQSEVAASSVLLTNFALKKGKSHEHCSRHESQVDFYWKNKPMFSSIHN